jgi:hypothetical protein
VRSIAPTAFLDWRKLRRELNKRGCRKKFPKAIAEIGINDAGYKL